MTNMKSKQLLDDFTQYCEKHPELRFWQALRNWSNQPFVFVGDVADPSEAIKLGLRDTYYWEGKEA